MELSAKYKSWGKKAAIVAVVLAALGGAGAWYHHSQEQAAHQQQQAARVALIEAQASQRSLSLIDEAAVHSITAEAIGQEETSITFRQISLQNATDRDKKDGEHDKKREDRKDKDRGARAEKQASPQGQPHEQPAPAANTPQPDQAPGQPGNTAAPNDRLGHAPGEGRDFRPVYHVKCKVGEAKYQVDIDAVTGRVLHASA